MIIREATYDDLEWLTTVCAKNMIEKELQHSSLYDYTSAMLFLENIISGKGICFIAVKEGIKVGAIAGMVMPHPYNYKITSLHESFWYVLPEYRNTLAGAKLLNAFTSWGENKKDVDEVTLSLLFSSPDLFKSLEKKGYLVREYVLTKIKKEEIE